MVKVAPSILSADFSQLENSVKQMEVAGADWFHVDMMDGNFVPNLSFGPMILEAIRPLTGLTMDVHLMIQDPEWIIEQVVKAGADIIAIHAEATKHVHRALQQIKNSGIKAGIVINPATPVSFIEPVLSMCDLVLVMSVNPGFGGQSFIPESVGKIEQLANLRQQKGYIYEIEVDGGINDETSKLCIEAGADVLVSGSYLFGSDDWQASIASLKHN